MSNSVFNDVFQNSDCTAYNEMVISEWWIWKDVEKKGRGLILSYYPGIYFEGLRKITKNLSQDSRSPGRDLNPEPPE
jgi:hypothetical protein